MTSHRLLTSVLALAAIALPASAAIIPTYSDIASFTAANTDQTFQNVTFDAFVGHTYTTFTDALTMIAFNDANGMVVAANPGGGWPAGAVLQTSTGGATISVAVPNAARSYSMNIGQLLANSTITISLSNLAGDTFIHSFGQGSISIPLFFGFRTGTPITNFSITADYSGARLALNGVEVGDPTPAPEVATLLMIGSGLIFVRLLRRRRELQGA